MMKDPFVYAGMRGRVITDRSDLWKGGPYKPLTQGLRKSGGRNAQGRITSWHRGGASKRLYRIIDSRRAVRDISGTLERIEYDPNRTARIALVKYPAGMCEFSSSNCDIRLASASCQVGKSIMESLMNGCAHHH